MLVWISDSQPAVHRAFLRGPSHTPGLALHTTVAGKCPSSLEDEQEKQGESRDRIEWISIVFSDESRFCLGASDSHVLVRRRPGELLQLNCLRPRHTGPTTKVMVWGAISYDSRSTLMIIPNTLTTNLYASLDNSHPHTAIVTLRAVQSIDMLPWPAKSPDLPLIELFLGYHRTTTPASSIVSIDYPSTDTTSTANMELHTTK
ncbi:uncharacterized protein TNCV_2418481 [Trichonephila clavipes]|nr:uncharacterized protein TNCV_2418481 [Trichonephila clavipes]